MKKAIGLGSSMPLANLALKKKRFMYLDEFSMVEYASFPAKAPTLPKTMQLELFSGQWLEVQVSQSFSNGNVDLRWDQGAAMTAKAEGLWEPTASVSAEDIRHLKSRVEQFTATKQITTVLRDVSRCKETFCAWVVREAAAYASGLAPTPTSCVRATASASSSQGVSDIEIVAGLWALLENASIPKDLILACESALVSIGAVNIAEVTKDDWQQLPVWSLLRPLQQRRILATVS
jgi:hypothetical protein